MALALPNADPDARKQAYAEIQRRVDGAARSLAGRVRHTLRPLLWSGKPLLPDTAKQIGMSPRHVQRLLAGEGTDFETIRDDVRFSASRELLALTPLSLMEIALSLGFATPSSFIRAFQRWSGLSPTGWRKSLGVVTHK